MKNIIKFLFSASLVLTLFSCDDEDGFYNEKYITTSELINITVPEVLSTTDLIAVDASIDRYIAEPGYTNLLDLYQTTGGAEAFTFSYALEKQNSAGEWEYVDVSDALQVAQGTAESEFYVLAHATFVSASNTYEYASSLALTQPGEYRLSFGVNSDEMNIVEFRSESSGNNINLNLLSSISGLESGYRYFSVIP